MLVHKSTSKIILTLTMITVTLIVMKRDAYEAVTPLPVLIPGALLTGERPVGTDTFRLHFPPVAMPRAKGDPRPPEILKWADEPVVQLKSSYLAPSSKHGKVIWDAVGPAAKRQLIQIILLRDALQRGDSLNTIRSLYRDMEVRIFGEEGTDEPWSPKMIEWAREKLGPGFEPKTQLQGFMEAFDKAGKHPTVISGVMTEELDSARIVLWWTGSSFTPAVWCEDLRTAVYVLSLPVFAGGRALAICPRCQEMFIQSRPDQTYDNVRCREAHRVARWRADHKKNKKGKMRRRRRNRPRVEAASKSRSLKSKPGVKG